MSAVFNFNEAHVGSRDPLPFQKHDQLHALLSTSSPDSRTRKTRGIRSQAAEKNSWTTSVLFFVGNRPRKATGKRIIARPMTAQRARSLSSGNKARKTPGWRRGTMLAPLDDPSKQDNPERSHERRQPRRREECTQRMHRCNRRYHPKNNAHRPDRSPSTF